MPCTTVSYQPPAIGSILGGTFRVERFVGAGAMGSVFEVADGRGDHFAAKVLLHPALVSQSLQVAARFEREARVTAAIQNEHVVRVHYAGIDPAIGVPFYVMDLLRGHDLETLIERVGPLHPTVASRVLVQASNGIIAAHRSGTIHRDIKPSNIFLHHEPDGRVIVKVCDFGIAKWTSEQESITASGSVLGTPLYMAPEQALNAKDVDERADVWSLAMSLYHALAGMPAYERVGQYASLLLEIVKGEVPNLQDAAPWIAPQLAEIVHGALMKDRSKRCPTPEQFSHALEQFTGGSWDLGIDQLQPVPRDLQQRMAKRARRVQCWNTEIANAVPDREPTASISAETAKLSGQWIGQRYQVEKLIGQGGMGSVYAATTKEGERVAIKLVMGDGSSRQAERLQRFVREAKALTSIDSPFVVRVVDVDTDTERELPFIAMELLNGNDLERFVRKWGPLEPEPVVRLFLSAAQGLAAAHATGVVHRDVKPANIFLHELPSSEVVPKIFDFGIAKQSVTGEDCEAAVALTQTGGMIGSPLYMSPEQAKNAREVDERSDIWSLGLSLWEALSGRRPWEECTTVGELVLAICTKNVTPLQDVAPWIEPGLAQIVHRCLQRDPQDRYASMSELAKSLEEFAGAGTQLTRASLIPVTAERRASSARRAVLQGYDELIAVKANEGGPNARYSKAEARRLRIGIWVGVGLVASMAAGNHLATKGRPTRIGGAQTASLEQTVIPNVAPVGVSAKKLRVNLEIRPADANVLMSGHEMAIANGTVTLEGLPGESFGVVVQTDAGRSEAQVVITTDGRTSPSLIEIPIAQPSRMPGTVAGKRPAAHTTSKVPSEPSPTDANSGMVRPVDSW